MNGTDRSKNEHKNKLEHQSKTENLKQTVIDLNIIKRSNLHIENGDTNFKELQAMNCMHLRNNEQNKILNNCHPQQIKIPLSKSEPVFINTKNNTYIEIYVPERYSTKYDNTFVMTFNEPSRYNYLKWLIQFGKSVYEYEDYIQYKLNKKYNKNYEILIDTVVVEKNAFHCQGLAKKIIIIKNINHVPEKIIFV